MDVIGVYIAPPEHYIGLGRDKEYRRGIEVKIEEPGLLYDGVNYEIRHFFNLLLKNNPTTTLLLWLNPIHYLHVTDAGNRLIESRDIFTSKLAYKAFTRYAQDQLQKVKLNTYEGYMGAKRKALVDKYGYDCRNASHSIRLLLMATEYLHTGRLNVFRDKDVGRLIDIKTGKWSLDRVKTEAALLSNAAQCAYKDSKLPEEPNAHAAEQLLMKIIKEHINA